jgi:hypothetical protein
MLSIGRRSLHRYIKKFNIVNDSTISIGRKPNRSTVRGE